MGVELGLNDTGTAEISWQGKRSSADSTAVAFILKHQFTFC
jgi:hypothetical protein